MNLREFHSSSSPSSLSASFNYEEQYYQQSNHQLSPNQLLLLQQQQQHQQLQQQLQQQQSYDLMDIRMMNNNRTNYPPPPPPPPGVTAVDSSRFSNSMVPSPSGAGTAQVNAPPGSPVLKRPEATFVMDISPSVVGWIIGRSGIRIKEIQAQTGCKMWVDQDVPNDQPRKIYFHGNKVNIDAAVSRVSELVQSAPILASASVTSGRGLTSTIVDCPVSLVGLLIGKRGWTIKKIQQASGAQISINQSVREGLPRKIIVSGDETSVATALHLIDEVLRDKSGMSQEPEPSFDPSSPGMNMYLGGVVDTYGRLDSPNFDPRLQSQGQGANMMYRQQYQAMSGTPPLMQNSLRYPSPSPVSHRSGDDPRNRMAGVGGSYESSLQMLHFDPNAYDAQSDHYNAGSMDPSFNRQPYYSEEQNGISPNPYADEYLRKNSSAPTLERAYSSEGERWNTLSYSGSPLVDSMMELNINSSGQESSTHSPSSSRQSSREDASLLSYHLRQQHQRSQQQNNLSQGHVFPLTQGKMMYPRQAGTGAQQFSMNTDYRGGSMMVPSSPIDPTRSFSDSSVSVSAHRSSQSNSFHSSTLSESPLNAGLFHFSNSPAAGTISFPNAGIAAGEENHLKSRTRLSSSSSSESYLDHQGNISRNYSVPTSAEPYNANGFNRNQLDDLNPMTHTQSSLDMHYPSSTLQPPRDHISRSLPNVNFENAPTSGGGSGGYYSSSSFSVPGGHDSLQPSSASFPSHSRQSFLSTTSPAFGINTDPYPYPATHGRDAQVHALYSPLYSNTAAGAAAPSTGLSSSSPPQAPLFNDDSTLYGFSEDFLGFSSHETPPPERSSFSGLLGNNPEVDITLRTSFGSVGSAYDNN
jgi:hypothetical protein